MGVRNGAERDSDERGVLTGTRELEEVLLLELHEDAAFDLDKLIRHEECEDRVRVRVDGHVECHELVEQHQAMCD